jgi:hypothetical protein
MIHADNESFIASKENEINSNENEYNVNHKVSYKSMTKINLLIWNVCIGAFNFGYITGVYNTLQYTFHR